jgi:hypothetical protein
MATDLAVTVDDNPGVLAGMGEAIGKAGINISGVCGAAAGAGSVVHLLVDDAAATRRALEGAGFSAIQEREVLVLDIEDKPGALGEVARRIANAGVNIELVYLASGTRIVVGAADLDAVRGAL